MRYIRVQAKMESNGATLLLWMEVKKDDSIAVYPGVL